MWWMFRFVTQICIKYVEIAQTIWIFLSKHNNFYLSTITVCSIQSGMRKEAVVCLFCHFWGPKGLVCDPKTRRKLLLGQKCTLYVCNNESSSLLEKMKTQDLVIWEQYTVCPNMDSCLNQQLHTPCDFNLWPPRLLERKILIWMLGC